MQRIAMNQQAQRINHYQAAQMMNSNNRQELMHGSTSTDQLLNELSWIIQTASGAPSQSLPPPPFIYTLPPQQPQSPHMYHVNQNNFRETMTQYHTGNVENRSGEGSIWSTPLCSPLPQMQPVSVASFPFPPPPHHHHYASSSSNNNSLLCSPSSNSSNFSPSPCSPPPMSARLLCGESNNNNGNVHHSNQSTPRPIRKALFVAAAATATTQPNLKQFSPPSSSNNTQSSNKMADGETMTVAKNGSGLHAQSNVVSSNSSNEQRAKQGQQQRGGNSRSSRGPVSGSPPSAPRHRHQQQQQQQQKQSRQLPIRSKNIDLSQYLASLSLNNNTMPSDSSTSKAASTNGSNISSGDMKCAFCENNRESREVYTSHNLKDSLGKIVCPILRNFVCPKCGESGDYAHTDKYCPVTQRKHKENKIRKFFSSTATSVAATSSFHH